MKSIKHIHIHVISIGLSGVIFGAEGSKPSNNAESSSSSLNPGVSEVLAVDSSGLAIALSKKDEPLPSEVPEWAQKLTLDVEDIKKTQQHILRYLTPSDRRRSSASLSLESLHADRTFPVTPVQHKVFRGRVSFSEIPTRASIDLGSSAEMTAEQLEAETIDAINTKNQNKANHRKDLQKMRLAAEKSFRAANPGTAHSNDKLDLESVDDNDFERRISARSQTGKLAMQLRSMVAMSVQEDNMHRTSALKKDASATSAPPRTSPYALTPVRGVFSRPPASGALSKNLPASRTEHRLLPENPQACSLARRRAMSYTPATAERIALTVAPHPPTPAQGAKKPPSRGTVPSWLRTVTVTATPTVIQSTELTPPSSMNPSSTSLTGSPYSQPSVKKE